jgi:hypothetical protein
MQNKSAVFSQTLEENANGMNSYKNVPLPAQ